MDRTAIIDEYETQGGALRAVLAGLTVADLKAPPAVGGWSIQQIVLHIVDTDMVFADRIKRVIAEDNPPLAAFDQNQFVSRLFYDEQSAQDAATMLELSRRNLAKVLRKLPADAFDLTGVHSDLGPMTLSDLLIRSVGHLKHHLKFAIEKREKLAQKH